jgi:carbon-monoxide dehydrogenase catalytic subunit
MSQLLYGKLKAAVFGDIEPTRLEVNMGVLQKEAPNLLLYGNVSPLLKAKIAQAAEKRNVGVMGVCTDPLLPPYRFFPVTNYGSQEIPLMTGAVDLIVAGDQSVNPSLVDIAKEWSVTLVPAGGLDRNHDLETFAAQIVEQAQKAFDIRRNIPRDIPEIKEPVVFGYTSGNTDVKKMIAALNDGEIKGIALFAGSNNVKYKQDSEFAAAAGEFLKNDILCVSEGEASVTLAKYGFLNPEQRETHCGKDLQDFLSSMGENTPPILDWEATDFLLALSKAENKALNQYPITACFSEANRTAEVSQAIWTVAMGVSTYFWPSLPVTGSPKTVDALTAFCHDKFGAKLHVITQKMAPKTKAELFLKELQKPSSLSGKSW